MTPTSILSRRPQITGGTWVSPRQASPVICNAHALRDAAQLRAFEAEGALLLHATPRPMVWRPPVPRMGLWVTWETRGTIERQKSPWPDTLRVYVAESGGHPRFLSNAEEVDRRALRTKLLNQLSNHAEWSVYFEAAPDTLYMDSVYAIDTIQACGAKVIWITPRMREEWQETDSRVPKTHSAVRPR